MGRIIVIRRINWYTCKFFMQHGSSVSLFCFVFASYAYRLEPDYDNSKTILKVNSSQLTPENSTQANSNLVLSRTKIDFSWISFTHLLLFFTVDNSNPPITRPYKAPDRSKKGALQSKLLKLL